MKVLLLEHPRGRSAIHFNDIANTPLSSCLTSGYIASLLQANDIETDILDAYLSRYSFRQMVEEVIEKEFDILGIHLVYSWEHTPGVLHAIDEISHSVKTPIIVYGFYPTFAYESILKSHRFIDYAIIGEPEFAFLQFCELLEKGKDIKGVNGLACRNGNELITDKKQNVIENLDLLPFPYRTKEQLDYIGGNILGSRGCYGHCTFCYINNFYGKSCDWRGRTPENIYQEIKTVLSSLSSRYIYFVDANFFGQGDQGQLRSEKIAEHLQDEKGLRFGLECRVNDIQEGSLKALAQAGLQDVFLGVESGAKRSLRRMRKGTTVEQGVRAIELLRNYGIEPYIGFIMFESDSELQDIRDNLTFLKNNNLLEKLITTVDLLYHPHIVLMGTDSYISLQKENRMVLSPHSSYQGTFSFKDDRVQFLADVISPLCHHLLTQMSRSDSPIYWRRNVLDTNHCSYKIADRLNQWLVEYFEDLLRRLECRDVALTDEIKSRYINESIDLTNEMMPGSVIPTKPDIDSDQRGQAGCHV
jgi:hypothetical protein